MISSLGMLAICKLPENRYARVVIGKSPADSRPLKNTAFLFSMKDRGEEEATGIEAAQAVTRCSLGFF
jgi:hypothetical protein